MAPIHAHKLLRIKGFDDLIAFLREELDWPIAEADFDDLFFEYGPQELGLKDDAAAKIRTIKQLRPLVNDQPFGIFFIEFEPKRMPVVALRRILNKLVVKKRASANKAELPAWKNHDLIFISSYGPSDSRVTSFAHFKEDEYQPNDLPTLRVLYWDAQDTAAHLEEEYRKLTTKLRWPERANDIAAWREQWSQAFTVQHGEVIRTSKRMAERLAELARAIRARANEALEIESDDGPLRKLHKAFKEALIHDLTEDDFADMYAQTIAYGLLSARVSRPAGLTADNIVDMVPVTNPFLQELLASFLAHGGRDKAIDFDELGVNDVVEVLRRANMEAVLKDFGDKNPQEDPVIHFYELFLKEYDKKKRMQRGVFYTPRPVVSYIVRSVHELLQTEFGLEDGLADTATWGEMVKKHPEMKLPPLSDDPQEKATISPDEPFVQILDPATGTATFIVEVIDVIHAHLTKKWTAQGMTEAQRIDAWNEYVPNHLLPRLYGYELMMAPYAIAHMKIGLKLTETGYRFETHERVRVYLTNALEPWVKQLPLIGFDALAHEAAAVNEVKRHKRFTISVGNPPYAGHSANASVTDTGKLTNIGRLLKTYFEVDGAPLGERNPKWLQDDYVKFVRCAQSWIDVTTVGILGFITNHGYLDNPTFRGMREKLVRSFGQIQLLDLHGNLNKRERTPEGGLDENVFDIQQGVAIGIFVKRISSNAVKVTHANLWGERVRKYEMLLRGNSLSPKVLPVDSPTYYFFPQDGARRVEYLRGFSLSVAAPVCTVGIVTGQDAETIGFTKRETQALARRHGLPESCAHRVLYRPMDRRFITYSKQVVTRPREEVMQHMLAGQNLGMITTRSTKDKWDIHVTDSLCGHKTCSGYDINYLFPLYVYEHSWDFSSTSNLTEGDEWRNRRPNLTGAFLKELAIKLELPQRDSNSLPAGLTPEDIFRYIYAVFHSPGYRARYAEFLKIDFPRLPLTESLDLFRALAALGGELVALHLIESSRLDNFLTTYRGPQQPEVGRVGWSDGTVWLDAGKTNAKTGHRAEKPGTTGFHGVPENVWDFQIGGYQVCHKWLKDRKGRTLTDDDIAHYQKIVVAIHETIRIMKEIDDVIEEHGGWPGAFATGDERK